jgi:DNA polymerase-1
MAKKKTTPLTLLIDGDMIVFQACSSAETEINWGDEEAPLWTLHAEENEAKVIVDTRIQTLTEKVLSKLKYKGEYVIILCFTDDVNFRKKLYPLYKANRIGKRKPVCYQGVKKWAQEAYSAYQRPTLEADDCIGILATAPGANAVIISSDKDFLSIPGYFYDYGKDVLHTVTKEEAIRWHLYQTLIGDTADNYPGCPGVGEVGAKKILEAEGDPWTNIVKQYEKKGLTEADALLQARVSKILQWENFDVKTKEIILWNPPSVT